VLIRSSRYIRADIAMVVDDVRREHEETQAMAADPENIPALTVSDVDFSYGAVQVSSGSTSTWPAGETLALLGTNGAGKSTVLRVIAGLGTPSRGTIRLDGRNITFSTPSSAPAWAS
jgi:ABC-type sugar transport system ATPase subunit